MSGKNIRILAVSERDQEVARFLAPFELAGYDVTHERVDGAGPMTRAVADQAWDLVICGDAPSLTTATALDILDQRGLDVPVVIVSDSLADEDAREALQTGASDALTTAMLPRLVAISERALKYAGMTRQHKLMQSALKESEARFRTIASNIPGMVYQMILEASGGFLFTYVSEGAYALLGVRPRVFREQPSFFLELIAPDDRQSFNAGMNDSAISLTAWNWEGRILIGDEREVKWINLRASPRPIEGGAVQWEGIMWNITKSKLAEHEILGSRQQLQALSSHLETIKERERANIAREIHDDIGGTLTAIKIDLLWLANRVPTDRADLLEKVSSLEGLVDQAMTTSTRIARDLRPSILDFGVVAAIEWQTQEFRKRLGIECQLTADGDVELDPDVAMAVFRIFQETLTNISKHAGATRVQISIGERDDWIKLQVLDNGRGMARQDLLKPRSFGIRGMRERARYFGGDVDVKSTPGQGTTVTVRVPLAAASHAAEPVATDDQQALF
jgi:two-component system sensor histidine kinase UhpB